MDSTVHGVAKSQTRLSDFHFHFHYSGWTAGDQSLKYVNSLIRFIFAAP